MNTPLHILYIDDNPHDQELVLDSLEKESGDFIVTLASTKDEFEKHFREKKYDLILSDFNILGYEGLSVLKTVINHNPALPVIIVTGTGSEEIAVEAMKQGADDYVIKSTSHIRHLPLTIKAVIEKKNLKIHNEKAQDELLKLRQAVENSSEIIIMMDTDGVFKYINPEFSKVYGYSSEEVIGKYTYEILLNGSTAHDFKSIKEKLLKGSSVKGELLNRTKGGNLLHVEFSISPVIESDSKINNFLAIQRDITERKKAEELLKKNFIELETAKEQAEKADKLKTEFLAQMSHEIRTPINNIVSYNSLLKSELFEKADDDIKYAFDVTERASRRLIRTIDLILNMSELQTNTYSPFYRQISVVNILEQQSKEFAFAADKKGVKLRLENCADEGTIFGDEYTVTEILQNLIDNAVKYTKEGTILIKVNENESKLFISIIDTGVGISGEYLPNLFTPFSQEYSGYTRPFDGNGLGLAITKKYIEINKGKINFQSEKGKGTSVTVEFTKIPFSIGDNL